ncbi:MAG: NapC/NirT family cytochrome c [Candidatus Hydrothermarchaeota archaeon]
MIIFSVIVAILLSTIGVSAYKTYDYIENDPNFCKMCHLMEEAWVKWDRSKHSELTCHTCHIPSMTQNMVQLYNFIVLRPKEIKKHTEIDNEVCEECHYANDPRWPFVKETVGHKKHVEELEKECLDCHGERIHRFIPTEASCNGCHKIEFQVSKMQFHCLTCHEFLASEEETTTLLPRRKECLLCHEEKEAPILSITPQAHRESDCKLCHRPHERDKPLSCKECHVTPNTTLHMIGAHGDCTSCHVVHIRKEARDVCLACHPDKKDHHSSMKGCSPCHS